CHPGDCHYTSGNLKARARWTLMEKVIEQSGVNPKRVRLQWASASEAQLFADGVRTLVDQIKELGPIEREWR
ncbi:MAG: hydrogenase iron-sulfur subunit, partial [Candidatus Thorarchaeota archaeon]